MGIDKRKQAAIELVRRELREMNPDWKETPVKFDEYFTNGKTEEPQTQTQTELFGGGDET